MAKVIAQRPVLYWVVTLVIGVMLGVVMVDSLSAAPAQPGPPGDEAVREQNLDEDGNIKVHEQGVADVNVTNSSVKVELDEPVEVTGVLTTGHLPPVRGGFDDGFFIAGGSQANTFVPEGVIVTDIVARFTGLGNGRCGLMILDTSVERAVTLYSDSFVDETFNLNLISGLEGPIRLRITAVDDFDPCTGNLFWSGYSTP